MKFFDGFKWGREVILEVVLDQVKDFYRVIKGPLRGQNCH